MTTTVDTVTKALPTTLVEQDLPSVREWAISAGFKIGARGRFSQEIVAAYTKEFGVAPTPKSGPTKQAVYTPSPIRAWATENGYTLPARGRFSLEVTAAYNAAMGIEVAPKPAKVKKSRKVKEVPVEIDEREAKVFKVGGRSGGPLSCGFCETGHHDRCPDVMVNGKNVAYNVKCACSSADHV